MKDYYAILGVSSSAPESDIKKAFRRLAVRYHPDKNQSADAVARFHEISEAYDILGDVSKRAAYDARRANPFAEVLQSPPHRDPAYRRPRPRARRPQDPPASYILMRDSLPYVLWVSRAGLAFTILFFLDLAMPYKPVEDYIQQVYAMRHRGETTSYVVLTRSGEHLEIEGFTQAGFTTGGDILLHESLIFRSVMAVSNPMRTYTEWVAYIYTTLIFFPILLFITSLLALLNRKRVEFCFNLNITASILFIINITLI